MVIDPCPCCGEELSYDEVDVGVGTMRGSAFCPSCYWSADNDRQPEPAEPLEPDPDKEFKHEKRLRDLDRNAVAGRVGMDRIPGCPCQVLKDARCERCTRLAAIGAIVETMVDEWKAFKGVFGQGLDVLDAIAFLLIDRAKLRRAHQQELREMEKDANASAREAFYDGQESARRDNW